MSAALVKYVLKGAIRDRLLITLLAMIALGIFLSLFMSSSALIEKDQFSIVYLAASLRLFALSGVMLFIIFFVRRSFLARDVEYLLTRPVTRASFILSHALAFSLIALIVSSVLGIGVGYLGYKVGNLHGTFYWITGLTCEYLLMANVAFFFAMVLTSPTAAALASFGLYVLGRMMGQLLMVAKLPPGDVPGYHVLAAVFKMVSMLVPRLDLMTQTSWLLYGVESLRDYWLIIVQAVFFLFLILMAALIDLRRRQF